MLGRRAATWRVVGVRCVATAVAVVALTAAAATVAAAQQDPYSDVVGGVHKPAIDALGARGVFEGTLCDDDMFCPSEAIGRSTMAVWLIRALEDDPPPVVGASRFADVDDSGWQAPYIERLAELGVTAGCGQEPLRFCPDRSVTRAQMASFLTRAYDLDPARPVGFADIEGSTHEASINALAAAGISAGCGQDPLRFCPDRSVTRAQMATFLARAPRRHRNTPTHPTSPRNDLQSCLRRPLAHVWAANR